MHTLSQSPGNRRMAIAMALSLVVSPPLVFYYLLSGGVLAHCFIGTALLAAQLVNE